MPLSFASKIIREYHIDDCTTTTGSVVSGSQWPARVGTGAITGATVRANKFGSKRGAEILGTNMAFPDASGVASFAFVGYDAAPGGLKTFGDDTICQDGNFNVAEPRIQVPGPGSGKWYGGPDNPTSGAHYKNNLRAFFGTTSRKLFPELMYFDMTTSYMVNRFGTWFFPDPVYNNNMIIGAILLLNAPLTPSERTELANAYKSDFGITANALPPVVICRGDSMTAGWQDGNGASSFNFPFYLSQKTDLVGWDITNTGIGGNTTDGILNGYLIPGIASYEGVWIPLEAGRPQKLATLWIGTNDLGSYSASANLPGAAQTAYDNVARICNALRATGVTKIVLMTLLDRNQYGSGVTQATWLANRAAYNALILANTNSLSTAPGNIVADVVIDLNTSTELQNPANTTYFGDGLHLKGAGYQVVADRIYATGFYNSFLAGSISLGSVTSSSIAATATAATGGTAPVTYQWYGSTTNGFTPGAGNIISGQTSLSLTWPGRSATTTYYLKLVATDAAASTVTYSQVSATTAAAPTITAVSLIQAGFTPSFANLYVTPGVTADMLTKGAQVPGPLATKLISGNFTANELMGLGMPSPQANYLVAAAGGGSSL